MAGETDYLQLIQQDLDAKPQDPATPTLDPVALTPEPVASSDYEALIDAQLADDAEDTRRAAFFSAWKAANPTVDPARAVDVLRYQAASGLTPEYVADHFDEVKGLFTEQQLAESLVRAPKLAGLMQDAARASAVRDDAADLAGLEWLLTGRFDLAWRPTSFGLPLPGAPRLTVSLPDVSYTAPAPARALRDAAVEQRRVYLTTKKAAGAATPEELDEIKTLKANAYRTYGEEDSTLAGLVVSTAKAVPPMLAGLLARFGGAAAGAAAGGSSGAAAAGVGAVPGSIGGGAAGVLTAGALFDYYQNFGPTFDDLTDLVDEKGHRLLTDEEARQYAHAASLLNAGVGTLSMGMLAQFPVLGPALKRMTGNAAQQAAVQLTKTQALKGLAKNYGEAVATGSVMMAAQNAINATTAQVASSTHGGSFDFAAVKQATTDGLVEGFKATALLVAWEPGRALLHDLGSAHLAEQMQARMQAAIEQAQALKIAKNPEVAEPVVAEIVKGSGMEQVYLPHDEVVRLSQELQVDPVELVREITGGNGQEWAEVAKTKADLPIPSARYITRLANTKLGMAMWESLKLTQDGISPRQVREKTARVEKRMKEVLALPPEKMDAPTLKVYEEYFAKTEQAVYRAAREAGKGEATARAEAKEVADANARNVAATFTAWAAEVTRAHPDQPVTALDLWERFGGDNLLVHGPEDAKQIAGDVSRLAQTPDATLRIFGKVDAMRPEERARAYLVDEGTGVYNRRYLMERAVPADRPMVAHFRVMGVKWLNDAKEAGGHEKGNQLYRLAAAALQEQLADVAKVGGDFGGFVRDQAHANEIVRRANEKMGGFWLTAVAEPVKDSTADAYKAAGLKHDGKRAAWEKDGFVDAEDRAQVPTGSKYPARGERPPNVPAQDVAGVQMPEARGAITALDPEMAKRVGEMPVGEFVNRVYVEESTGLLTGEGFHAQPNKGHVSSIDLRGLKAINEQFGELAGDVLLETFGDLARRVGGSDLDFAHLSGDEFASQHADPETHTVFLDKLREACNTVEQVVELDDHSVLVVKGIDFLVETGASYDAADQLLSSRKQDLKRAGVESRTRVEHHPAGSEGAAKALESRRAGGDGAGGAGESRATARQGWSGPEGSRPLAISPEARARAEKVLRALQSGLGPDSPYAELALPPDGDVARLSQVQNIPEWVEKTTKWMEEQGYTKTEIAKHIAAINGQMTIFAAIGPVKLEMLPKGADVADDGPIRSNQDPIYKISFDASAMCVKRLEAAATAAYVQAHLDRALTAPERMALVALFRESGKAAPCVYCYVEAPRSKMGEFVGTGLDIAFKGADIPQTWAASMVKLAEAARAEVQAKGLTLDQIDWANIYTDPARAGEPDARAAIESSPALHAFLLKQVNSAKANAPKLYEEYSGQFLDLPDQLIKELNGYAGVRFFSSSDFQFEHVADLMQALTDLSLRGAAAHSYTKVPEFVEIFGRTGMKINMSIFAKEEIGPDGKPRIVMDDWQGMNWEKAQELRGRFEHAGTVLVGTSDAIIEWGLNQPWVDYIIPYHHSGLPKVFSKEMKWKDYTRVQNEKWIVPPEASTRVNKAGETEVLAGDKVFATLRQVRTAEAIEVYRDDELVARTKLAVADAEGKAERKWAAAVKKAAAEAEDVPKIRMHELGMQGGSKSLEEDLAKGKKAYLKLVKKRGLTPVFPQWVDHPNYFKLKKDYARTDSPFAPVRVFDEEGASLIDLDRANEVLEKYFRGETTTANVTADLDIAEHLMTLVARADAEEKRLVAAGVQGKLNKRTGKRESVRPNIGALTLASVEAKRNIMKTVLAQGGLPLADLGDGIVSLSQPAYPGTPQTFYQRNRGAGDRGHIEFKLPTPDHAPRRFDIALLAGADRSTLAHETAHYLTEVLSDLVGSGLASAEMAADYATLVRFMGYESHEARLAAGRERLALAQKQDRTPEENARLRALQASEERVSHAWEMYLAEGRAPAPELVGTFTRFKNWMKRIYGGVQGIADQYRKKYGQDIELSPEVRKVFDRMLAAEEEVRKAEKAAEAQPFGPVLEHMVPEERARYIAQLRQAREQAEQEIIRRAAEEEREANSEWAHQERERIGAEVEAELDANNTYRALWYLQHGEMKGMALPAVLADPEGKPLKLDRAEVVAKWGKEFAKLMPPGVFAPRGKPAVPSDTLALLTGFDSGEALVRALQLAEPREKLIVSETQKRLEAIYGKGLTEEPGRLAAAALETVHNDARLQAVVTEIRGLAQALVGAEAAKKAGRAAQAEKNERVEQDEAFRKEVLKTGEKIKRAAEEAAAKAKALFEKEVLADAEKIKAAEQAAKEDFEAGVLRDAERIRQAERKAKADAAVNATVDIEQTFRLAEEMLAGKMVREIAPDRFLQAEQAAARRALAAAAKGDFEKAKAEKEAQLTAMVLFRVAREARAEVDAGEKLLARTGREPWRKQLGKADAVYRDAHDSILAALGIGEQPFTPGAFGELVAKAEADGHVLDFDVDLIRNFLPGIAQKPRGWADLTLTEARNVVAAVKSIRHLANEQVNLELGGQRMTLRAFVAEAARVAAENLPEVKRDPADRALRTTRSKIAHGFAGLDAALIEVETLVDMLGGRNAEDPLHQLFVDGRVRARNERDRLARQYLTGLEKAWEAMPEDVRARRAELVDISKDLPLPPHVRAELDDGPITRSRLWMIALNMGNDGNRQRLLDGYGWEQGKVLQVLQREMSRAEWDWVQGVWDSLEGLYPLVEKVHEEDTGLKPGKVVATPIELQDGTVLRGGYFPVRYDPRVVDPAHKGEKQAEAGVASMFGPSYTRAATLKGHTQDRAAKVLGVLDLDWSVVPGHVAQVIHDIAFRRYVKQAARVLFDPGMEFVLKRHLGEERAAQFKPWLRMVANEAAESVPQDLKTAHRVMSWAKTGVAMSALGYSLKTALGDFANPFVAAGSGLVSATSMAKAVPATWGDWRKARAFALEHSGEMRARQQNAMRVLRDRIGQMSAEAAMQNPVLRWAREHAFIFMETTDRLTSTPVWTARYQQSMAEGLKSGLTEAEAHAKSVRDADYVIRRLFPATEASEQPAILRDRRGLANLVIFWGYMGKVHNLQRGLAHEAWARWQDPSAPLGDKVSTTVRSAATMMAVYASVQLLSEWLSGRGPEGDEETGEWALRKMLAAPISSLPIVGPVGEVGAAWAVTGKQRRVSLKNAPGMAFTQDIVNRLAGLVGNTLDGDLASWEAAQQTIELLGFARGIPTKPVTMQGKYLFDVLTGEVQPENPLDFASGLVYGERKRRPGNPFSAGSNLAEGR